MALTKNSRTKNTNKTTVWLNAGDVAATLARFSIVKISENEAKWFLEIEPDASFERDLVHYELQSGSRVAYPRELVETEKWAGFPLERPEYPVYMMSLSRGARDEDMKASMEHCPWHNVRIDTIHLKNGNKMYDLVVVEAEP
jgi:hypothetical protein